MKLTTLIALLYGLESTSTHVLKHIPEHLKEHYNFIDPKVKHVVNHGLTAEDFKPPVRDVKRKKTHEDIPRVPEHKYSHEEIPEDEHIIEAHHLEEAEAAHHVALRERKLDYEKRKRDARSRGEWQDDDLKTEDFAVEAGFSKEFALAMVFKIYFRDRWMKNPEESLVAHAISLERELYTTEVNY